MGAPGGLSNLAVQATVTDQYTTQTRFVVQSQVALSYLAPVITASAPTNGPDATLLVTLQGIEFGHVDGTLRVSVGSTACQSTQWVSSSAAVCKRSATNFKAIPLALTVLQNTFTMEQAFTADTHVINNILPGNSRLRGGLFTTIFGAGFGTVDLSPTVRVVQPDQTIDCTATQWQSDSSMVCMLPQGNGLGLGIEVEVRTSGGGANATAVQSLKVFSYDIAQLTDLGPRNIPLVGSTITFLGINFGTFQEASIRAARVGDTACGEGGSADWVSDSAIRCRTPLGFSEGLNAVLTVNRIERLLKRSLSYNTATISSVRPTNGPASGITDITVTGVAFGSFQLTPALRITDMICKSTRWVSDTSILCSLPTVPPQPFYPGGPMHVGGLVSRYVMNLTSSFTYDRNCIGPCISGLSCLKTVNGKTCDLSPRGDMRHSLNAKALTYDSLIEGQDTAVMRILGNFSVSNGDLTAGNATVNTTKFVTESFADVTVVVGGLFNCELAGGSMQSYLDCYMPPGVGDNYEINVSVRNASFRALELGCAAVGGINCIQPGGRNLTTAANVGVSFSYSMPQVTSVSPSHVPNQQNLNTLVTIFGSNFGSLRALEVYDAACAGSTLRACKKLYANDVVVYPKLCTKVNFMTTAGITGAGVESEIVLRKLAFCDSDGSYALKGLNTSILSDALCTERCSFSYQKCGRNCPTNMLLTYISPYGGYQVVTVVQGGQSSNGTVSLVYDTPNVYEIFPPELPVGGSSVITVLGRNFGVQLGEYYLGENRILSPGVYDSFQAPIERDALLVWVVAGLQVCWSTVLLSDVSAANVTYIPVRHPCDLSTTTLSQIINFDFGTAEDGTVLEQIRVYLPSVVVPANATYSSAGIANPQYVSVGLNLLKETSATVLQNSTLAFKAACNMRGDQFIRWYLGLDGITVVTTRANATLIAYPSLNAMFILGGTTNALSQTNNIYVSYFTGIGMWRELLPSRTSPWFDARNKPAACVHRDLMFIMGGSAILSGSTTLFNDVWVYAVVDTVANAYKMAGTTITTPDTGWEAIWVQVTAAAPWAPRAQPICTSFGDQIFLFGGVKQGNLATGFQSTEIWTSYDGKTWNMTGSAPWKNRNDLFVWKHGDDRLFAMGSVQSQFYGTWYSYDGVRWLVPANSCPLVYVDVQAAVYYGGYSLVFTAGCHDNSNSKERAVSCSSTMSGPYQMENRVYYTQDETTLPWKLALRSFSWNDGLNQLVWERIPWSAYTDNRVTVQGEYRWDYSVEVFEDSLYVFGGQTKKASRDLTTGAVQHDPDGSIRFLTEYANDIWISKGLLPMDRVCLEKTQFTQSQIYASMISQNCPTNRGAGNNY